MYVQASNPIYTALKIINVPQIVLKLSERASLVPKFQITLHLNLI